MKREGNLYGRILETQNLNLAFLKAAKGKYNRPEVVAFRADFETNIHSLQTQLLNRDVAVGDYRFFYVRDPKKRLICAASFTERVLHHAVMNICEPFLDAYAIHDSYACRHGKGSHKAMERAQFFSRECRWYLKLDIRKYFDSISHCILLRLLERRFKDKDLLGLFRRILDTYHTGQGRGVPIGNLVSQHMANFYLGALDHWIKETKRIKGYVRYMDDFIVWTNDRKNSKDHLAHISAWLNENLDLHLKTNIQLNRTSFGVPFLGYRIYPDGVRLMPPSKRRFIRKFRAYEQRVVEGDWSEMTLCRHVEPLVAFVRAAASMGFRKDVFSRFGVLS